MDWLVEIGYIGLFLGAVMAGTVFPFSTDVLLIGILMADGNPLICIISATLGNWLGAMISYGMGWIGKWEWLEKWFNVKEEKLRKQKAITDKYGVWVAFFSWFPIVGTLSIIALGFYKVKPKTTSLFILIGCFVRFLTWVLLYMKYGDLFVHWVMSRS